MFPDLNFVDFYIPSFSNNKDTILYEGKRLIGTIKPGTLSNIKYYGK